MPTPIGHALGGAIVALLMDRAGRAGGAGRAGRAERDNADSSAKAGVLPTPPALPALPFLPVCALAACLPDLDFLWGRHNMETHSVGFAMLVGLAVLAWRRDGRLALACGLAVLTHVLFDWLGSDDFPPLGVMALWPFTREFYFADAFVFEAVSRRYWLPGFVLHNVLAVLREVAILGPIAGAFWWWRVKRTDDGDPETGSGAIEKLNG